MSYNTTNDQDGSTAEASAGGTGAAGMQGFAEHAEQTVQQMVEDCQSLAGEYAERGREIAADWAHTVEQQIRAQPLRSVLVAGGVGFVLGWFWTHRS